MLSTNKLIAISLTGAGLVGAGTATFYALNTSSNTEKFKISKLINDSGRTILVNTANTWDIKNNLYERTIKSLNIISLPENNLNGLKTWCAKTINKEIKLSEKDKENSIYELALKLCTKPTNAEKLAKNSKTIVAEGGWKAKETAYRNDRTSNKNIPTITDKVSATEKQIKDWCTETLNKEIEDSENTYEIVAQWCTNN